MSEGKVSIIYYKLQTIPHPSAEGKTQYGGGQTGEIQAFYGGGGGAEGRVGAGCGSGAAEPTQDTYGHFVKLSHPPSHSRGCLACEGEAEPGCHWSVGKIAMAEVWSIKAWV